MNAFRNKDGGFINRECPVNFTFDGKTYQGFEGDTVASALLANGVHLVGRSFKYHRPRGFVSAGSDEPNALVRTSRGAGRSEPNTRSTIQEIYEGLEVTSQNSWPNVSFDVGAINDFMGGLFSAGFYYKTFMWPKSFWDRVYEPIIRASAGLGRSPSEPDPDIYASRYMHCDVLVVGAGAAGLAAARRSAISGADVVIVDENNRLGGSLLSISDVKIDDKPAVEWLVEIVLELKELGVRIMTRTTAIGYYHQNMVGLCEKITDHLAELPDGVPRERMWRVRAGQVVLAQGALEKPLVFAGNDRPGVMLASAAQTYLNRYGVKVGNKPVIVTSHDSAWQVAFDLHTVGAKVAAIIDVRNKVDTKLVQKAEALGIKALVSHTATGTTGRRRVSALRVNPVGGNSVGAAQSINCDCVLMSGGWTPSLHLFSHTKSSLDWDSENQVFLPGKKSEDCFIAGAGRGLWGVSKVLGDGDLAGAQAAKAAGFKSSKGKFTVENDDDGTGIICKELPTDLDESRVKAFIDFQNDVTAKDIRLAVREGMRSIEHVKRYTTNGMATDQGKMSNMNGLMIASDAVGKPAPEVGLTTFRPPYTPTTFGTFAGYHRGELFDLTRKTPIDGWAEENGAVFEDVALWRRARYFPVNGENMHQAVTRECKKTRQSLGIFDASTLGKIEISGPDAAEFMNRMYTNPWTKLASGRCRYGLMLGEDGFILDDGVIGRLNSDLFHVTTTTGGAARVLNIMEDFLQTEWPQLNVWFTSTTEQWSTIALNGPNARNILEQFVEGLELSDENFPHMSIAECKIFDLPCRLFRLSFTGELGFEVNIPSRYGLMVWERLIEAGKQYDICPYGTEAMHVLRAEKGYIIVGQDTDGTVTPHDVGMSWAIGKKKTDFVGMRSLKRPDLIAGGRKQLIGLLTDDPKVILEEGAQIVADPNQPIPMKMIGHVTSSYWSEALGKSIALALVEGGHNLMGSTIYIPMPDKTYEATICDTVFYDPDGERLKL